MPKYNNFEISYVTKYLENTAIRIPAVHTHIYKRFDNKKGLEVI